MNKKTPILFLLLIHLLLSCSVPAAEGPAAESTREKYESLKARIEADPEKDREGFGDDEIGFIRENLNPGFNFGNEMDWTYKNKKVRKYGLRFSLCSGEKSLFTGEVQFNMTGGLSTVAGPSYSSHDYVSLKFTPNDDISPAPDIPLDSLRVYLFNPMAAAAGTKVSVDIKYLRLTDNFGDEVFADESVLKTYPVSVSPEGTLVVSIPIQQKAEDFLGPEAELRADIHLDRFLSDYWDDPAQVFRETYNGEPATEAELAFLKEQGFRTIRLPVTWAAHMDSTGTIDPGWFDEVNKIADRALRYGFTVIVNIHHDAGKAGWITADPSAFARNEDLYRFLVLQIAENFKHYCSALILEGPNEVTNPARNKALDSPGKFVDELDTQNHINQIFIDEVRRTGYNNTDRLLMVSPWYGLGWNLRKYVLPQDPAGDRILTSIHDYSFREDGILKSLTFLQNSGLDLSRYHLVMGEFGILRETDQQEKIRFMEQNMALAEKMKIPMILWDDGGNYALMKKMQRNGMRPTAQVPWCMRC